MTNDAQTLLEQLASHGMRLVLAESCTGGMVAAELAKVAGVSEWFCGSAVTYRNATKVGWLGVDPESIDQHTAVSQPVAEEMAGGVLQRTPEAQLAVSITGHFGPDAPTGFDGLVFIGTALRTPSGIEVTAHRHQLKTADRASRQVEATGLVIKAIGAVLNTH